MWALERGNLRQDPDLGHKSLTGEDSMKHQGFLPKLRSSLILSLAFASSSAIAQPTYISGHINNVTFAGDQVLIMVDAGLPDNCVGTSYGWMKIPPEYKSMSAFV